MAILLPPSIQADFLVLRRAGWMALVRTIVAPALLVSGCGLLACGSLYVGYAWCTPVSAMFALAGSYALSRNKLTEAMVRARFGWCAALPVRPAATHWTLLAMTAVALIAALLAASLLLAALRVPAPYPDALGFALLAVDGGLVVGTAAATLHVLRSGAVARMHHADGIREPLLTLPWLNDPHLPHLLDWQRRAALVSWRRGGSFVVVGGVLAVVPHGAVMPKVVALLLLVLSLVWLAVVMRTCAAVAIDAKRLLGAMPLGAIRMRLAALRYPLVAAICAAVMAVTGSIVAQTGVIALAWFACAIAASAWPLGGVIHATAPGQSR